MLSPRAARQIKKYRSHGLNLLAMGEFQELDLHLKFSNYFYDSDFASLRKTLNKKYYYV
jgi:hypothetical protein